MKFKRVTRGMAPLLMAALLPGCTDPFRQSYISKHVLGLTGSELELASRAKAVPFEDLKFDFQTTRSHLTIRISSDRWRILGFGSGFNNGTVILSEIAGIADPSGSTKSHTEPRIPGRKLRVEFIDEDEIHREIFREP